ncbi:MAG TPA: ribonuclease III [Candidatus Krumholzibacteria bacterium]|nr:ribonuclease III [Candidatus Krumholzibacteria bacterium]HPD71493.1 ribonuclease III [Candidatus Krumholzibacteria bacterium]HRY41574.1 ribonuclease III [Candidatus Krumholzibacteria bacterium]
MRLRDLWRKLKGAPPAPAADSPSPAADPARRRILEAKLGHSFGDPSLLDNALLHRSHAFVVKHGREDSNERLEFLGDAVLGLVVNDYLYGRYPETSEGDLTKMKSLLVCKDRLSEVAGKLGLGDHISMSRSEAATGGRRRASILCDTTEAVIGAIYLDGGLAAAQRMISRCLLADCDQLLARRGQDNYKSRLQEIIQARFKNPPRYRVTSADGPDHARLFRVSATFNGHVLGVGEGSNKKAAEQEAARQALATLSRRSELLDELAKPPAG